MHGKFLTAGDEPLVVRGVTYGTFAPGPDGTPFGHPDTVAHDFALMAANGVNCVRTYTVPPPWLLDLAAERSLRVMAGVPWEQHLTVLDDRRRVRGICERLRRDVRPVAGHPALLALAVGNEIPAPVARWHGPRRTEAVIRRLYEAAKEEDPGALVTYVSFPPTEYLELPFLDLLAFNVYLEDRHRLRAYLARLQVLAGDRPLLMAEVGLDSRRNGTERQASVLAWQIEEIFAVGAAGAFVFSWTDEWHRGGVEVDDWDFGLVDRARRPKPALAATAAAYAATPLPPDAPCPPVTVVVCSYNGARTIGETCDGLTRLDYPDLEVIVVDDGSTDATAEIAAAYGFQVIRTSNRGLSAARNTGWRAASGEIIAYIDDDAVPDRNWLRYLAAAFATSEHAALGGPNLAPPGAGRVAGCVAHAPGGPLHVLIDDAEAEHVPGCNMAFRRGTLAAIGGFDERFRVAGDDVDVCWRVQEHGGTIGFCHPAMVWHRRRASVRAYLRQQRGYGRAEAMLEEKWPERYNGAGHPMWRGRVYGDGRLTSFAGRRWRVYYGVWGSALFQRRLDGALGTVGWLPLMPEWWLMMAAVGTLALIGLAWPVLAVAAAPALALMLALTLTDAVLSARAAWGLRTTSLRRLGMTTALFLLQPLARLAGRLGAGLHPMRRRPPVPLRSPLPTTVVRWSESWRSPEEWVARAEAGLRATGARVARCGPIERADLDVRVGLMARARVLSVAEEHGQGRQLLRFRVTPRVAMPALLAAFAGGALAAAAAAGGARVAAALLGAVTLTIALLILAELGGARGVCASVLGRLGDAPVERRR